MAKELISIRIDQDVLDWLRAEIPNGYQRKINEMLRQYKMDITARENQVLGRAQQIFVQYYSRCFWHLRRDIHITSVLIPIIQEGLRKHGGRDGFLLADELNLPVL